MMNLMVLNSAVKSNILKTFIVCVKKKQFSVTGGAFTFVLKYMHM